MESALKDMAVVMKQLDRAQEAIEAITSFRGLCPRHSQESLDNILIDLYKVYIYIYTHTHTFLSSSSFLSSINANTALIINK